MALSITEKAEKFDKEQARKKDAKVDAFVLGLRATELTVNGIASVGLGALKEARPAWEQAAYSLPIDGATFGLGLAIVLAIGGSRKKSAQMGAEGGYGLMQAATGSLGQKGGKALYKYLAA